MLMRFSKASNLIGCGGDTKNWQDTCGGCMCNVRMGAACAMCAWGVNMQCACGGYMQCMCGGACAMHA